MTVRSTDYNQQLHFANIFKRHEYKLYTLVLQLTKSDQYAKDIVQDVFLKLWQRRNNIAVINDPEALLYKLTENHIMEFLARSALDKRLRDALWVNMQHNVCNDCEYGSCKEYNQLIESAIGELPPQRQRIYQSQNESGFHYTHLKLRLDRPQLKQRIVEGKHFMKKKFSNLLRHFQDCF